MWNEATRLADQFQPRLVVGVACLVVTFENLMRLERADLLVSTMMAVMLD